MLTKRKRKYIDYRWKRITDQIAKTEDKKRKIKANNVYHHLVCYFFFDETSVAEEQESLSKLIYSGTSGCVTRNTPRGAAI